MSKISKSLLILAVALGLVFAATPVLAEESEDATDSESAVPVLVSDDIPVDTEEEASESTTSNPSISMLPTSEYVALKANTPVDKELTITNDGKSSYRFRLYTQPYTIDDSDGKYTFAFNTMNSYTSIYNWVSFQTDSGDFAGTATYEIQPGESKVIAYRVNPPSAVPAGGQYAAIFAETINEEALASNVSGIYTVSRVALLLYGRSTEGVVIDSEIYDYNVPSFLLGGPISASSKVKSLGNIDVAVTYKMIVRSIFGSELYGNTWTYPVLPDTERYVNMTWEDTPSFGLYRVEYSVSTKEKSVERTTVVLIFPIYMMIIAILLLTIISIWIIIILKKRKERKSRLIV